MEKMFAQIFNRFHLKIFGRWLINHSKFDVQSSYSTFVKNQISSTLTIIQPSRPANVCRLSKRCFSQSINFGSANKMDDKKEEENHFDEAFQSTFLQILNDIYSDCSEVQQLWEVKQWHHKALEYNISDGKKNRAKALVMTYRQMVNDADDLAIRKACILGWCVELLQSFFIVHDDVMDNSITRRGKLCWYQKENVGNIAINDGIMINNTIYFLLKKYFATTSIYVNLIDLFTEVTRYTAYGQCLDLLSNQENKHADLAKFTDERFDTIVRYKTAYYSFCLPIRSAMYMADIVDQQLHGKTEKILLEIGHYFQVQDDYLDFYGDPKITGKIGTDIADGKCTWLIVQALKLANQEQKTIIEENYGVKSEDSIDKIKKIYHDLNLDIVFQRYEQNKYEEICRMIELIDDVPLSKDIFYNILSMIHKRNR